MPKKKKPIPLPCRSEYDIAPVPKPRQTRRDKWEKRLCVMRYRAFADQCRAMSMRINESGSHIVFIMPMPESWSKKKKAAMDGQPHKQKPDIDNLCKSIFDALHKDDSHIYNIQLSKFWGEKGKIIIT